MPCSACQENSSGPVPDAKCRQAAERLALVGADVVEVLPSRIGSTDLTALVADRIVREILTGIALRRRNNR